MESTPNSKPKITEVVERYKAVQRELMQIEKQFYLTSPYMQQTVAYAQLKKWIAKSDHVLMLLLEVKV